MRRPRRLFVNARTGPAVPRVAVPRTLFVGVLALGAGVAITLAALSGDLFGRDPIPSGVITAEPRAVAVIDGETLRLHDTVIRLQGVTAPQRGATCPTAGGGSFDCGREAAAALGRMLRDQTVACRLDGRDPRGLPLGACDAGDTEINRAIIAAGWARAAGDADGMAPVESLTNAEHDARAAMVGVWKGSTAPVF